MRPKIQFLKVKYHFTYMWNLKNKQAKHNEQEIETSSCQRVGLGMSKMSEGE